MDSQTHNLRISNQDLERDRHQNLINLYDPRVPQRIRQIVLTMLDYVCRVVMQVHMRQVAIQRNFQYDLYLARLRQRGHMDVDGNFWSELDDLPEYIPVEFNTNTPGATMENVTENMGTGISSGPSTVEYRSAHESSVEHLWNEIEMRRKDKEARKNMTQNQKSDVDEEEAAKSGVSSGPKSVHEFVDEPVKEDVGTSRQQNHVVQSPSKAKQQKME
ncbi:hypothetical protein HAX54_013824 [Datura stramonium]|uniref:Uncharacterized protein n=1 Tax=Datura stramonium TaxID=4076 RepID=A0ABS8TPR2_DATST|nr:hypothetical protein [Datura stramonium]